MPVKKEKKSPVAKRNTPKKYNTTKNARIQELEKEVSDLKAKNKTQTQSFGDFQRDVGLSIIPFQKIMLWVSTVFLIAFGIGMIVYAKTHPDMDLINTTQDNLYITGGILIGLAVVWFLAVRYWLNTVAKSPNLQKLNAGMFEFNLLGRAF